MPQQKHLHASAHQSCWGRGTTEVSSPAAQVSVSQELGHGSWRTGPAWAQGWQPPLSGQVPLGGVSSGPCKAPAHSLVCTHMWAFAAVACANHWKIWGLAELL